ncbi:arsenate reductase (glutaredoxin) [Betaproteobacteria bacterium]|nr:arsenate reductase (glutaredoxin) [Betaproteobacteria bacterium]
MLNIDTLIVFHNPRCSKSRQVLALLDNKDVQYKIFPYLENEISYDEFKRILGLLKLKPRDILRVKEKEYLENNLNNMKLTDEDIIKIVLKNRKLIERPIAIKGEKAVIARPPEKVFQVL